MVVLNGIAVIRLGKRRKHEHANGAIAKGAAVFGFIPEDEQGSVGLVDTGAGDGWYTYVLKPRIAA